MTHFVLVNSTLNIKLLFRLRYDPENWVNEAGGNFVAQPAHSPNFRGKGDFGVMKRHSRFITPKSPPSCIV